MGRGLSLRNGFAGGGGVDEQRGTTSDGLPDHHRQRDPLRPDAVDANLPYIAQELGGDRHPDDGGAGGRRRRGGDRRGGQCLPARATPMCSPPAASGRPTTTSPRPRSRRRSGVRYGRAPRGRAAAARATIRRSGSTRRGMKMAEMPEGAELIDNPVSVAPGFRVENVTCCRACPRSCRRCSTA